MAQAVPVVGDGEPAGFLGECFLALQGLELVFFGDLGGDDFEDVVRDPAQRDRVVLGGKADQVVLRLAAVLDRERVDALDDHHGLVLGDLAGGHRVPDRLVVVVQRVGEVQAAFGVPLGLESLVGPPGGGVGGTGLSAEVEAVGVVGVAELELGDLVPQLGQGGQVGLGLGRAQGPQPEVGDLVQLLGDGGDRGRDRVAGPVSSNAVVIQGILASATDTPGDRDRCGHSSEQLWRRVSTVARWRSLLDHRRLPRLRTRLTAPAPTSVAAYFHHSTAPREVSTLARWRSLLDHRTALACARCSTTGELSLALAARHRTRRGQPPAISRALACRHERAIT